MGGGRGMVITGENGRRARNGDNRGEWEEGAEG